jgi:putative transcriptional regulator
VVEKTGLGGSLLIAMPQLQDPNFRRSVVLMVHHDEESSFGLLLNRPSDLVADDFFAGFDFEWKGDPATEVGWGGPVELNSGWILFGGAPAAIFQADEVTEIVTGLHLAGSLDVFRSVAASPPEEVRLFLGYSGWGAGQLESEIAHGAWLSAPVTPEVVFRAPAESMWDLVVRGLGVDPATLVSTSGIH